MEKIIISFSELSLAWFSAWSAGRAIAFNNAAVLPASAWFNAYHCLSFAILTVTLTAALGAFKYVGADAAQLPHLIATQLVLSVGSALLLIGSLALFNPQPPSPFFAAFIFLVAVIVFIVCLLQVMDDDDEDKPRWTRYVAMACLGIIAFLAVTSVLFSFSPKSDSKTSLQLQGAQSILFALGYVVGLTYLPRKMKLWLHLAKRLMIAHACYLVSTAAMSHA